MSTLNKILLVIKYFVLALNQLLFLRLVFLNDVQTYNIILWIVSSVFTILAISLDLFIYTNFWGRMFYRIQKLGRSIIWFFRMYNNHEWDHAYFLQVIKWKLEDMLEFYSSDDPVSGDAWKVKDQIEHALYYLSILEDEDNSRMYRFVHPIYGDYECKGCAFKGKWITNMRYQAPNERCYYCIQYGMDRKTWMKLMDKQRELFKKEDEQFFLYVSENFENWWD